jgi:iron complex outermembrane receptor protein
MNMNINEMHTNTQFLKETRSPRFLKLVFAAGLVLLSSVLAIPAIAQDDKSVLEEITVTAQRRAQSLQDVGIAVNAFTDQDLKDRRLNDAADVAAYTPNVDIKTTLTVGNPNVTIRGIGLNDFNANNSSPAGVYVDEVFLTSTSMMSFQLFDLERVEVLKGPQGTLYGRNTTAGAMNFITKKPSQEFDAYATATGGNYGLFEAEGAVGGPITDTVAYRLSAKTIQRSGGPYDSRIFGEHGDLDIFTARAQLLWDINDEVSLELSAHGDTDESEGPLWTSYGTKDTTQVPPGGDPVFGPILGVIAPNCAAIDAGRFDPANCVDAWGYSDTDGDPYSGDWQYPSMIDRAGFGGRATLTWEFGETTLTSVTGYENLDRDADDGDTTSNPTRTQFHLVPVNNVEQFSQEVRLSGGTDTVDWVGGFFYSDDTVEEWSTIESVDLFGPVLDFLAGLGFVPEDLRTQYKQDTTALALFAHTEWELAEQWNLIVGLRYTDEERKFVGDSALGPPIPIPGLSAANDKIDEQNVSGKVALEYFTDNDAMIYGSVSTGFKSGGFFGGFALDPSERLPYDKETISAYELGFKSRLADNTLQLNAAAFYYDYEDMQQFIETNVGGIQVAKLDNIPDASTITGLDVDLWWRPTDGLDIRGGLGILDSELGDFTDLTGVVQSGKEMANAPGVSASLSVQYEWDLGEKLVSALVGVNYTDDMFRNAQNNPLTKVDAYTLVDGRLALSSADGEWDVALWAKNLTDEEYVVESFGDDSLGSWTRLFNTPRTYGITASFYWQ